MVANSQTPRGAVFVLGMHRSGTSALTRGLEVLGVELGKNLKAPVAGDNEKGFFEDWALSIINDDLLALKGGQWDSLFTDEPGAESTDAVNALKLRALAAIDKEFGHARYFGFKDPRTCRTMPFWKDVLARMGVAPFYIIAFRNPLNVAKSLEKRDGMPRERAYYLWLLHTLSAIRNTEGEKRIFVDYDDLIADPRRVLERVAGLIGDPNVAIDEAALRAYDREFLDPGLTRNRERASSLTLDNSCPALVREVHAALRGETGAESRAVQTWRDLLAAFDAGAWQSALLVALDREMQVARQLCVNLEADAAAEVSRLAAKNENDLVQERERRAADLAQLEGVRAELQTTLGRLRKAQDDLVKAHAERQSLEGQCAAAIQGRRADVAALKADIAAIQAEFARLRERLSATYASTSWRVTRPLRGLRRALGAAPVDESIPAPPPLAAVQNEGGTAPALAKAGTPSAATLVFFTICSRNFLAFAKTLFQSLREHHPGATFYVALCDAPEACAPFDPDNEPFPLIYLDHLDLPQWREMAQRYNITEFNTAIKPFVIRHLMRKHPDEAIVYLDPDIIVKSRMVELEEALENGASVVLTPHITGPAENVELGDSAMLRYGIYNLGFVAFQNSPRTAAVVEWWGRRLINQCVIDLPGGIFVDQKWADLFPAFLADAFILRHPGYNVAYWNIGQRQVVQSGGQYFANGLPLRFAHFSGSKLEEPKVFSRHSGQFNPGNIGDLSKLLDEYRARTFANNHAGYRCIPYAFSWLGASGVNEHTPPPSHEPSAHSEPAPAPTASGSTSGVVSAFEMVRTATKMAGGLPQLAAKATRAFSSGGFNAVRQRIRVVQDVAVGNIALPPAPDERARVRPRLLDASPQTGIDHLPWRKRMLFIDWSTPRPDRDAGSVQAFHMMEILTLLGYDVTFIPSDLEYLGDYTEAVRALGVRCLHREDIGSVKAHLERDGARYDFALLCRAPVAALYVGEIRRHAPRARIILNTSDLHFLRDMRGAQLSGDPQQIRLAETSKVAELKTIRQCDVTIVMSEIERQTLVAELACDVRVMPLIFANLSDQVCAFRARRDIIFIGGFLHQPNVDAVRYFADEIFPRIRARIPDMIWHIVGGSPPPAVRALGERPGIRVHDHVKDIEPIFQSVRLSVAPLRYGAGVKGKLATSSAYGVPTVATSIAAEGMNLRDGESICVADDPVDFANTVVALYGDQPRWERMSAAGRAAVLNAYSVPAGHHRLAALMCDLDPDSPRLDAYEVRSFAEYKNLRAYLAEEIERRNATEIALIQRNEAPSFHTTGYCAVCGAPNTFQTSFMFSYAKTAEGKDIPNWREHLDCASCKFQNRLRASIHLFYALMRPHADARIYVTEQTTALFRWLRARHPNVVGSEFLGARCALGEEADGLRNEDMTRLTFEDDSFDYVLSFDVLEHVSDDVAAIREVYRCLKPGGRFFFAAPFAADREQKLVRASLLPDGNVEHILPPEYHGNPVDPENGALCFRYFAWDLLADLQAAGFENCRAIHYWSRDFAYLGHGEQFLFIAEKPRSSPISRAG